MEGVLRDSLKILSKSVYVNFLPAALFDAEISIEAAKRLFAHFVEIVEVENHSYCNRTCWFCPNHFLDRRSEIHLQSDAVFMKQIYDLASIDYNQTLVWARYHEPLAHESIFGRLAAARRALPNAFLVVTSNGDYLNQETVRRLEETGLDRLILDLYLPDGKESDDTELKTSIDAFRRRTRLELEPVSERFFVVRGTSIDITLDVPIFKADTMSSRGGLIDIPSLNGYRRRTVCLSPLRHVVVDYNGKGMLCCQTRSDAPAHGGAVIGDLNVPGYGLFHLYRDLAGFRQNLVSPGEKAGLCLRCNVSDVGPDKLARRDSVANLLSGIPGMETCFEYVSVRRRMKRRYEST